MYKEEAIRCLNPVCTCVFVSLCIHCLTQCITPLRLVREQGRRGNNFIYRLQTNFIHAMSTVAPPGGASVQVVAPSQLSDEAISKQPTSEEIEQTRIHERHAILLRAQQVRATEMAKVQLQLEKAATTQANEAQIQQLKKKTLDNIGYYLRVWLATVVVDNCDQVAFVDAMQKQGVADPIEVAKLSGTSKLTLNTSVIITAGEINRLRPAKRWKVDVVIDRPGHVLHECKLCIAATYYGMIVQVYADKAYKQPTSSCVMQ
jgi:hypothetical protein